MDARDLPALSGEDMARLVRALGRHRYVGGRLHLVHAFVFCALDPAPELADAAAWGRSVLADAGIDKASKDERLWRRSSEEEIALALGAFWGALGEARERAHARLREQLWAAAIELPAARPFDETREDYLFP